jgi:hypothetical protein
MSNPAAFKIVAPGTPSAFDPKQKICNSYSCGTLNLPLVQGATGPFIYGDINPLNLSGICEVVLPVDPPAIQQTFAVGYTGPQFIIEKVKGCVQGQTVNFLNKNATKHYSFQFGATGATGATGSKIVSTGDTSSTGTGDVLMVPSGAIGYYSGSQLNVTGAEPPTPPTM